MMIALFHNQTTSERELAIPVPVSASCDSEIGQIGQIGTSPGEKAGEGSDRSSGMMGPPRALEKKKENVPKTWLSADLPPLFSGDQMLIISLTFFVYVSATLSRQ